METTTMIGVFRPSNDSGLTVFYLDSDRDRETDSNISFGMPTDVPIIGDWNDDGTDDIGVFRINDPNPDPRYFNNAVFYLNNGAETITIPYGVNSDIPIIGKPYPDGRTRIGVYRPSTEEFIFNQELLVEPNTNEGRSGGPDDFGYTFKDSSVQAGPTYDWIDITSTGTKILPNSDDSYMDGIPVGFFFNFYGTDYSRVSITNNGIVLASGGTGQYTNQPIGASTPHNFISPFWDDIVTWDSVGADAVYYKTIGESPNREFIVQWNDSKHFSNSESGVTFEAIL